MPHQLGDIWNCTELSLFKSAKNSLQQQLFALFKEAIENGSLSPGEPVPSTRELCKRLGLSRVTVLLTYNRLIEQGYLESKQSFGTFVRSSIPPIKSQVRPIDFSPLNPQTLSQYAQRLIEQPPDNCSSANQPTLCFGLPPTDFLPIRKWKQLLTKAVPEVVGIDSIDGLGDLVLRASIADYLKRSRSINCSAQQVAICSNSQSALALLSQLLLNEQETAIVEEPGFGAARQCLTAYGANVRTVPVDAHGAVLDNLKSHPAGFAAQPKLVYLTPSHQDPTGAILSLERRKHLIEWNRCTKAWIIEDDIDCEYRNGSAFAPAIISLDDSSRVIYINSFWRTLYPLCSLSFVVLPLVLVDSFAKLKMLKDRCPPPVEQRALAHCINNGILEHHIRKTSAVYSSRRRALVSTLARTFGARVTIAKHSGALNQLLAFNLDCDDNMILSCAESAGIKMVSTRDYYIGDAPSSEFLVSFGHADEESTTKMISQFARLVSQRSSRGDEAITGYTIAQSFKEP